MNVIAISAGVEIVAGLALIVDPALFASLVFGAALPDGGLAVGRIAGIGLLSLGIACWPGVEPLGRKNHALRGLLSYNSLVAIFCVYLGLRGDLAGVLLWPVAALHAYLAIAMARIFGNAAS